MATYLNITVKNPKGREDTFSVPLSVPLDTALSAYCIVNRYSPTKIELINVEFESDPFFMLSKVTHPTQ